MSSLISSTIILSGGGDEKQSLLLDNFFFQKIKDNGSILYIPIALRGHRYFDGADQWFKGVLSLHNRKDINITTIKDLNNSLDLNNFDAVYIGGGNTWNLFKEIKESGFDKNLKDFSSLPDKILYGGSAGAIIFGKYISCQHDEKLIDIEDSGLDLIGDNSVACHYETSRDGDIENWYDEKMSNVIAISEDSEVIPGIFLKK
jgi:dipeptidase E